MSAQRDDPSTTKPSDADPTREEGRVSLHIDGAVAHIRFDRPKARNAMTWSMYEEMAAACAEINRNPAIRVTVFRGTGGEAFVAGTDIAQFQQFASGEDGVAYETQIERHIEAIELLRVPSLAVVEGYAVGGGLLIANACDIRIAAAGARFGVPIARTLGNCLSAASLRRLCATLGISWVKRMLLLAEMPIAEVLQPTGYVEAVVPAAMLDAEVARICDRLIKHAPLTMHAARETIRRLAFSADADTQDLIRACYGSADFHRGIAAFETKTPVDWEGR